MVRAAMLSMLIAACGRVSFDPSVGRDGTAGDDSGSGSGSNPLPPDSNQPAVCGDNQCSGAETCKSCVSDCKVAADVCGNGECSASEDTTTCFLDCGPTPRPYDADESALLVMINNQRAAGITCPMGTVHPPSGALASNPAKKKAAQDWAWERAHQDTSGFVPCNRAPWSTMALIAGQPDNTGRMNNLTLNDANCNQAFDGAKTDVGIGIANDHDDELVLIYN